MCFVCVWRGGGSCSSIQKAGYDREHKYTRDIVATMWPKNDLGSRGCNRYCLCTEVSDWVVKAQGMGR
jgi:hypothetical protein